MLHTRTRLLQTQLLKGDGDPTGQFDNVGPVENYFHKAKDQHQGYNLTKLTSLVFLIMKYYSI